MKKLILIIFIMVLISFNHPVSVQAASESEGAIKVYYTERFMKDYEPFIIELENTGFDDAAAYSNYTAAIKLINIYLYPQTSRSAQSERLTYWRADHPSEWILEGDRKEYNYSIMRDYQAGTYKVKIICDFAQPSDFNPLDNMTHIPRNYVSFDITLEREATFQEIIIALIPQFAIFIAPFGFLRYQKRLNNINLETYTFTDTLKAILRNIIELVLIFPLVLRWIKQNKFKAFKIVLIISCVYIFFNFDWFISGSEYWYNKIREFL